MQEMPDYANNVFVTRKFLREWSKLTVNQREHARKKVALLTENYRHPSLRTHPLHRSKGYLWDCSLSKTERLVYSRYKNSLVLRSIGRHAIVEQFHIFNLSDDEPFMGFDQIS
jgi:mRNA-degrading endonuclease YafQ of YafQ-DinJ toxin-antitoxin module